MIKPVYLHITDHDVITVGCGLFAFEMTKTLVIKILTVLGDLR
jgi:hypothetical protein